MGALAAGRLQAALSDATVRARQASKEAETRSAFVDDHLKELMQELGNAINESLSESESMAEVIGEIRRSGYDVYLVLEATIGFNKRKSEESGAEIDASTPNGPPSELSFTAQDEAFLRALKITVKE